MKQRQYAATLALGASADHAAERIFQDRFEHRPCCTVGGELSGLASGKTLELSLSGGVHDTLTLSHNGPWAFGATVPTGTAYAVTISQQPQGQTCAVTPGSGTMGTAHDYGQMVSCGAGGSLFWNSGIWGQNWN